MCVLFGGGLSCIFFIRFLCVVIVVVFRSSRASEKRAQPQFSFIHGIGEHLPMRTRITDDLLTDNK